MLEEEEKDVRRCGSEPQLPILYGWIGYVGLTGGDYGCSYGFSFPARSFRGLVVEKGLLITLRKMENGFRVFFLEDGSFDTGCGVVVSLLIGPCHPNEWARPSQLHLDLDFARRGRPHGALWTYVKSRTAAGPFTMQLKSAAACSMASSQD